MGCDSIVGIMSVKRFNFWAYFLVFAILFFFCTGVGLNPFVANAQAQSRKQEVRPGDKSNPELNETALKTNIADRIRITRGVQDAGFRNFSPDSVTIDRKIPMNIEGMTLFAVKVKIFAPFPPADEETISLVVDQSGALQIADIQELATGKSLTQDGLNQLVHFEDIPSDFGKEIFKGTGPYALIVISDPFCPYCRKGWEYIKTEQGKLKVLRLAHFPLNRSAEVTCMAMADAGSRQFKLFEMIDFAYTRLNPATDPEEILKQFMDAFPELKKIWGQDPAIALKYLEENYAGIVQKEKKSAQSLGINSTPVFFVNGELIRGFNPEKLGKAMP